MVQNKKMLFLLGGFGFAQAPSKKLAERTSVCSVSKAEAKLKFCINEVKSIKFYHHTFYTTTKFFNSQNIILIFERIK